MEIATILRQSNLMENSYAFLLTNNLINDYVCIRCAHGSTILNPIQPIHLRKYFCSACETHYNSFSNKFFFKTKLTIEKICLLIYFFLDAHSVKTTIKMINDILASDHITKVTTRRFYSRIRLEIWRFVDKEQENLVLTGPVEFDECLIYKQKKGYEGRTRPIKIKIWLFGIKCRVTGKFLIFPLRSRTREVLFPIIRKHVQRGAWVYTDCFSSYVNTRRKQSALLDLGYTHFYVNHSVHFVNPILNHIHTNTIERMWRSARMFIRNANPRAFLDEHLACFYFHTTYNRSQRERILLDCIRNFQ